MPSVDKKSRSGRLQTRYYVALIAFLAMYVSEGNCKCFALVMTHITSTDTNGTEDLIFSNCTVFNSSRDLRIKMREDTMFLLHSTYSTGFLVLRPLPPLLASRVSQTRMMAFCLVVGGILMTCLPYIVQLNIHLLFITRWVQGSLDGTLLPLILGLLSAWTTDEEKGRLFTISMTGMFISPVVISILAMYTMCYVSWDAILYVFGASGILTGVVTMMTVYDTPEEHPSLTRSEVDLHEIYRSKILPSCQKQRKIPWCHMFMSPPLWAAFLGYFSRSFVYFIIVIGLSQYFKDAFSINIADISLLSILPHIGISAFCVLGGVLSDSLFKFGLSITCTRKLVFTVGHLTEGLCLLSLYFVYDWRLALALITVGGTFGGLSESGYVPLASDAAPQYGAETSGLASTGTLGCVVGSLTASAFCRTYKDVSSWQKTFIVCGLLCCGSVLFFNVAASAEVQPWAKETSSEEDTSENTELEKLLPESSES